LWSENPSLSALEIKNQLLDQGDPVLNLGGNTTVSGRRLNVNTPLNCIPGSPELKILKPRDQFVLLTGNDVIVNAQVTDCGLSIPNIEVTATPGNGDAPFTLFDDGQEIDNSAGDTIYSGTWQLQNPDETATLTVNAAPLGLSETITGEVLENPYRLDPEHPFEWIDATSGVRLGISDVDDGTETITIGFDFEFYGVLYSQVNIDSNGYLAFVNSFSEYINTSIPNVLQPNGFIAPYWDDLFPGRSQTGNIYTLLEGTAPNRSLTIAWIDIPFFDTTASDNPVTFEVTLYEGSNDIIFQYGNAFLADSATIGIEHQTGEFGFQYLFNGENEGQPIQINQEQAIRFFTGSDSSPDIVPPSVPQDLALDNVTANVVSFSWTPSTDAQGTVVRYHILRDGNEIGTSSVASFTDDTVVADTAYVYNVTAEDDSGNVSEFSADLDVVTPVLSESPDLIAGYPFEEGSGPDILDVSGNGNNGRRRGGTSRNPAGIIGEAIEFNGSNSYIDLGTLDITTPTMSIALWFKPDDFGTNDARLISKATGTRASAHYWMVSTIRSSGQIKLRFRLKTNNGGTSTLIGSAALTAGDWTHVTATYDGTTMKLFQNGIEVGSLAKTGTIATSTSVAARIGANPGNTRYFDGLIDDVRIYGEALDIATIEDVIQGNLPLIDEGI
ncbi:MAG: LamG-like jellyroll fold domain-containing protein, partial [Methylococcales bacterium]